MKFSVANAPTAQDYLQTFLTDCAYPAQAVTELCAAQSALAACPAADETFQRLLDLYATDAGITDYKAANEEVALAANAANVPVYAALLVFYCLLTQPLWAKYQAAGYSRIMFEDAVLDLRYKAVECKAVHGIWGTFVAYWFDRFFQLTRFAFGRLQYETFDLPCACTVDGKQFAQGTRVINIHIPSAGPLTPAACDDSLAQARAFFAPELPLFMCHSWLLFPHNEEILAGSQNILHFMHRFQIIEIKTESMEEDMWRIFNKTPAPPFADLPCETSLQRAYAAWLRAGHQPGAGIGVFAR